MLPSFSEMLSHTDVKQPITQSGPNHTPRVTLFRFAGVSTLALSLVASGMLALAHIQHCPVTTGPS